MQNTWIKWYLLNRAAICRFPMCRGHLLSLSKRNCAEKCLSVPLGNFFFAVFPRGNQIHWFLTLFWLRVFTFCELSDIVVNISRCMSLALIVDCDPSGMAFCGLSSISSIPLNFTGCENFEDVSLVFWGDDVIRSFCSCCKRCWCFLVAPRVVTTLASMESMSDEWVWILLPRSVKIILDSKPFHLCHALISWLVHLLTPLSWTIRIWAKGFLKTQISTRPI